MEPRTAVSDPTQRFTEYVDPHVGFGSGRQNLFEFVFIRLGCVAPTAARKYFAALSYPRGINQRLVRHAKEQRIGLPFDFAPVLQQQGSFDSETPEPEVIVAYRSPLEQCFCGAQGGLLIFSLVFQQSEQTENYRSDKARAGLLRYFSSLTRQRDGFRSEAFTNAPSAQ